MPYRLAGQLPLEVDVGAEKYVLELVRCDAGEDCWLRARATEEPVVFLLAHFRDTGEAEDALYDRFDVPSSVFPHRLFEKLVAQGEADPVPVGRAALKEPPVSATPWELSPVVIESDSELHLALS